MTKTLYLNGDYVESDAMLISHKDCGFTTGIGIFDSMLAIDGALMHGHEHFERIINDTKTVIGISPSPWGEGRGEGIDEFIKIIKILLEKNNLTSGHARIRTTVTGGVVSAPLVPPQTPTILIDVAACSPPPETPMTCAIITDFPRIAGCALENCKRLDYSRSYAARRRAETLGAEEAILTNTDGHIACGGTSNIFIEESGALTTPPLSDGVLAGVTRRHLIETHDIREESITIERLQSADKIYLTNSFIGLRRVYLTDK